jgi:hypothetical protein
MPPGVEEYIWREQARELHAVLVGSIAPEERRAYLGDVQIAQDIAGVAHILNKADRLRQRQQEQTTDTASGVSVARVPELPAVPDAVAPDSSVSPAPDAQAAANQAALQAAIEALMTVDNAEDMPAVAERHPVLLTTAADDLLEQLADTAVEQRQYEVAEGLHYARMLLTRMRTGSLESTPQATDAAPPTTTTPPGVPPTLPHEVYQALLQVQSSEALANLTQSYPLLLEPWVDDTLSAAVDQVLEEGNERLAHSLEQRREQLAVLRQELVRQEAIEALLAAEDDETLSGVLIAYPVLLTDETLQDLWQLAADARSHGDEELARYAVECRAMLRKIREELSNQ